MAQMLVALIVGSLCIYGGASGQATGYIVLISTVLFTAVVLRRKGWKLPPPRPFGDWFSLEAEEVDDSLTKRGRRVDSGEELVGEICPPRPRKHRTANGTGKHRPR